MARHDEHDDAEGVDFTGATLVASGPAKQGGEMKMVRLADGGMVVFIVNATEQIDHLGGSGTGEFARWLYEKLPHKHAPFDPPEMAGAAH